MTWQTLAFLIVGGGAFYLCGKKFALLYKLLKAQTGKPPKFSDFGRRIQTAIVNVLGQKAVLQDPAIGIAHTAIFWGFLIITIGTLEQFCMTIYEGASFEFIGQTLYSAMIWSQDFFTAFVLFGVLYAGYRRFFKKPKHLGQSSDANKILAFTGGLMVSIFFMNAFHVLSAHPWFTDDYFISKHLAEAFAGMGFSEDVNHGLYTFFKWVHMCLVLGFAVYIPGSKHLHIVAAGPNTFLRKLDREKGMTPINFEDETVTQYGIANTKQMSWKDTLDLYSCTECGRCQSLCPAWNTEKPLSPKNLIIDIKKNLYKNKDAILAGQDDKLTHVIDEHVTEDVIWSCTSCRACEIACPVFIEHTDKIYNIRRNLVMMESKFPAEVQPVFKNMETNGTPWAFSQSERANWAEGLNVKTMAEVGDASAVDVLLWVGCAGAYDDRNKSVIKSFVSLLNKAGVKFATLGTEETCTGDAARRIGNEYLFQTLAKTNVDTLNRYQVKRIVTACPHCFNTLKNEYGPMGGNYEVVHHSQFIAKLIQEGKLKPSKALDATVTFHDSCYLGRWNNVYEQPRSVIESIPSVKMVEMKQHHDKGMCCGAGGGRMWMEEHIGRRVNVTRTEQALETNAGIIATACPFCVTMITDGVKTKEAVDHVQVKDISELLDQAT
ncbi:MAG: (Fe-S)-binding protein [Bdellovibrionales bacterium]|nr:(Fe-S)-binding protein [Bdellovibrionales bacterium]